MNLDESVESATCRCVHNVAGTVRIKVQMLFQRNRAAPPQRARFTARGDPHISD